MLSRNRKTKMNRGTRDTIAHVAGETEQALQPPGLENQRDQAVGAPTDSRFRPTETSGIVTDRVRADLCARSAAGRPSRWPSCSAAAVVAAGRRSSNGGSANCFI